MNPWIALGLVLVWMASVVGVGFGVGVWQNRAGHTQERVVWQAKNIIELSDDNKAVFDNEEKYRKYEADHATIQAGIQASYQERIKNANIETANLIAAARAGRFRLRDPSPIAKPSGRDNLPQITTGPGGCDGKAGAELSATASEFLLNLTDEADNITRQLGACQEVIAADRTTGVISK